MKKVLFFLLMYLLFYFVSCNIFNKPQPIPKDKAPFIGLWISHSGFQMEIISSGIARVVPITETKNPDYNKLDVGITPEYAKKMFVGFLGDSEIYLRRPQLIYRKFHVDKSPYQDGDTVKMVINGVTLTKH